MNVAKTAGIEVRKWHDGTRSDIGLRPIEVHEDMWLPVQVKATASYTPKFQWNLGVKGYGIPVLLATGDTTQSFLLRVDDLLQHQSKITNNHGLIAYGISAGYWREVIQPRKMIDVLMDLKDTWKSQYSLTQHGILSSEYSLQMECSADSQREWFCVYLSRMFSSSVSNLQPSHQSTVDRLDDGLKIQDKSAAWLQRENTPYFKAKCAKLLWGKEVPYELGDADMYCFAVVIEKMRIFMEWRIPEHSMDVLLGRLSHVDGGAISKLGRTCINLPVVGPNGENLELHTRIFGRLPRKDTDLRAALFLKVHRIPEGIVLPACVCGRDPVQKM
eukprot:1191607-Prymnesium_polylepis.1